MIAETYFLQALRDGLSRIQTNPNKLSEILSALNPTELASAIQWFGNAQNVITIAPGFPMEPTQLPFIGVTIADEVQIESQTGIGLEYYTITNDDGSFTDVRGLRFSGALKATLYTPDANLVVWISAVCRWALMTKYDWFGEVGFNNMNISMGDFEPSPGFLPIFTFARGLVLRAEYDVVFLTTTDVEPITSVDVVGEFSGL